MAISVNGEHIPDALVTHEFERLLKTQKAGNADPAQLRLVAACAVVDRVLIRQAAERDPRQVDPREVETVMRREMQSAGCRAGVNEPAMRRIAEQQLRLQLTMDDLAGEFPRPTPEEVLAFYESIKDRFAPAEKAQAAHIIVHVSEQRSEAEARRLIESAEAELADSVPFAEVAERFSDCKGNGGDLGWFERGVMVDEFDEVVFALQPGQRSAIFRTPFGYHIAELRAKGPGGPREPGMAQREIEAYLTAKRRREAIERGLETLRASAEIVRIDESSA
ncbi:MAG: prsA [Bryobacterales bacterium]|nr:prsA [Bryobacterales bacterium]